MPETAKKPSKPFVVINPFFIRWRNIVVPLLIGTTLLGAILVGYYYFQLKWLAPSLPISFPRIATRSAQKAETAGWKTYTGNKEKFKYQFKYPGNWNYQFVPEQGTEVASTGGPKINSNDYNSDSFGYQLSGVEMVFSEIMTKPKNDLISKWAEEHDASSKFKEIKVGTNQLAYGEVIRNDKVEMKYSTYYISGGEKVVTVRCQIPISQQDKSDQIIDQILSTFKFLD